MPGNPTFCLVSDILSPKSIKKEKVDPEDGNSIDSFDSAKDGQFMPHCSSTPIGKSTEGYASGPHRKKVNDTHGRRLSAKKLSFDTNSQESNPPLDTGFLENDSHKPYRLRHRDTQSYIKLENPDSDCSNYSEEELRGKRQLKRRKKRRSESDVSVHLTDKEEDDDDDDFDPRGTAGKKDPFLSRRTIPNSRPTRKRGRKKGNGRDTINKCYGGFSCRRHDVLAPIEAMMQNVNISFDWHLIGNINNMGPNNGNWGYPTNPL